MCQYNVCAVILTASILLLVLGHADLSYISNNFSLVDFLSFSVVGQPIGKMPPAPSGPSPGGPPGTPGGGVPQSK